MRLLEDAIPDVYVDDLIERWIVRLVEATRRLDEVAVGASVRGTLALDQTSRAWALVHGRPYVTPEDIESLFLPVLGHRLLIEPTFLAEVDATEAEREATLERVKARCLELAPPPDVAAKAAS